MFLKSFFIALLSVLNLVLFTSTQANAQENIAVAGTFSGWHYTLPPGSESSSDDSFIIVFNEGTQDFSVKIDSLVPDGVDIIFSQNNFTLSAGQNVKIFISLKVGQSVIPGEYEISAICTARPISSTNGIGIGAALSQKAYLEISGEFGFAVIHTFTPDNQPLITQIKLQKMDNGQYYEIKSDETATLEVRISPGSYLVNIIMGGEKLIEEKFVISDGETKTLNLLVNAVYFEGYDIVPAYSTETNQLAFIKVVYTVRNLYRSIEKADVYLSVNLDGNQLEEIPLVTLGPLDIGQIGLNYNYIPTNSWTRGEYSFCLKLYLDGETYSISPNKYFSYTSDVTNIPSTTSYSNSGSSIEGKKTIIILGIIAGILIFGVCSWFIFIKRRKS